jgi:hypothetical protein
VETFRKKCGKLSTEWKLSGKSAASFPPGGNSPEKVRQAFHWVEKPANGHFGFINEAKKMAL